MKSEAKKTQKWPMIRVDYCDPTKPDEIITLEEAATRFKVDERDVKNLREGSILGTSVNTSPEAGSVDMIHRYTREDSARDAAMDLLETLKEVVGILPSDQDGLMKLGLDSWIYSARDAIKQAERS